MGQCGADGVRALGEKPARLVPFGAAGQLARGNNPGGPLGERIRPGLRERYRPDQADFFSSPVCTFAFASSASAVNAAASLTARSARILRSTSTPAIFRPWMNRL
ncbi:MAG: hypothetical protein JWQ81_7039 [Amycolatopsis sp.]|nr:hypothetical protein [Amycolatopsis sp.]